MLWLYLSLHQWDDDRGELYGFIRRSHYAGLRSEGSLCCFRCGHCSILLYPHVWNNNISALVTALKFRISLNLQEGKRE